MGINGINTASGGISPKSGAASGQPAWDNHETSIRDEIKAKQEEIKKISKDENLSAEQKANQKQAIQQEIQSLNSELRQYQIQKRQEQVQGNKGTTKPETAKPQTAKPETAKPETAKSETAKSETAKSNSQKADEKDDAGQRVFGSEGLGVIITISMSQNQVTSLEKVRKDLEGKQRTAGTEEEKEKLQKKIDNVSKDIGKKMVITEESIMKAQKQESGGIGRNQGKEESGSDNAKKAKGGKILENFDIQNAPFENVSVIAS